MKQLLQILLVSVISIFIVHTLIFAEKSLQENKNAIMDKKILVVYFSATGTTKNVANNLALATNAAIYEIKPTVPYTQADLDWKNKNSRSSVEMKNRDSRPTIQKDNFSVADYDVIFLGFPIWWGVAPTIVNTFLEQHDFSNKKIILFATSGGSGFGRTTNNLKTSVSDTTKIEEGALFNHHPSVEELKQWANSL